MLQADLKGVAEEAEGRGCRHKGHRPLLDSLFMLPAVSRLCGLYHQPHAAQSRLQTHKGLPGVKNDRADSRLIAKALTHRGIRHNQTR